MLKWIAFLLTIVMAVMLTYALIVTAAPPLDPALKGGSNQTPLGPDTHPAAQLARVGADSGAGQGAHGAQDPGGRSAVVGAYQPTANGAAGSKSVVVEATEPRNREPLPGIDVWLLDRDSRPALEWQVAFESESARLAYIREHGSSYRTDEQGLAILPRVESGAVLAEGRGHRGELTWIGPVAEHVKLSMRALIELQVLVKDDQGRTVSSVPVAIILDDGGSGRPLMVRPTNTVGIASFTHVRNILQTRNDGRSYALILSFPQSNPVRLRIEADNLPSEVLEFRMPPAAALNVVVHDADGEQLKERMGIALGKTGIMSTTGRSKFQVASMQRTQNGRTRFPWVEVGLAVEVQLSGLPNLSEKIFDVSGPPVANEEHTAILVWDSLRPTLTGRAVGPDGRPLSGRRGRLQFIVNGSTLSGPSVSCNAAGEFRISMDSPWELGSERIGRISMGLMKGLYPMEAELDLSFDVPSGDTDLGDVHFASVPLLVTGRVIDSSGQPIAGARVTAQAALSEGGGTGVSAIRGGQVSTETDGTFQIFGLTEATTLRLLAQRRGYTLGEFKGVKVGSLGLEMRLLPGPDKGDFEQEEGDRGKFK